MIPQKLKKGDEIRVISPARSMNIISKDQRNITINTLKKLGLKVSFSENSEKLDNDYFDSASIQSRVLDLHEAFKDKSVRGMITTIGGFNSNHLLKYINYDLIKKNPKILCGYSDITALANAIYAKTGMITYSGPHFSTFGMKKGNEYSIEYFKKCLLFREKIDVKPSKEWSDDEWYKDQEKRKFIKNKGYLIINEGKAKGTIIGGNMCTFVLLHGTEYMPSLKDSILFLEECGDKKNTTAEYFDRDLQSIIHQPDFDKVKALVIGRFQKASEMTNEKIIKIIKTKKELQNIPIVANVDFGHTSPMFTYPIGGTAEININKTKVKITIINH